MSKENLEKNLALMAGKSPGTLWYAIMNSRESIGGNAGTYEGYPCFGTNFFYDGTTGEIKYFGNGQDVPREIRQYHSGTLRIALMPRNLHIVELMIGTEVDILHWMLKGLKKPDSEARSILEATVSEYNKLFDHS